jgi:hypothetical protein
MKFYNPKIAEWYAIAYTKNDIIGNNPALFNNKYHSGLY